MDIGSLTGAIAIEDQFSNTFEKAISYVKDFTESFDGMTGTILLSAGATAAAIVGIAVSVEKLGTAGSELVDVQNSFDRLSRTMGETGDTMFDALNEGVKGTVDDLVLMQSSMRLLQSGVKLTAEDMKLLGKTAMAMSKAAGTDAATELEKLNRALTTGQDRTLRFAGIIPDVEEAEKKLAASLGTTADKLSESGKLEAHRIAQLEAMRVQNNLLGESELNLKDKFAQTYVALDDFVDQLSLAVATSPDIMRAFDAMGAAIRENFGTAGQTAVEAIAELFNAWARNVAYYGPIIIKFLADTRDGIYSVVNFVQTSYNAIPDWLKNIAADAVKTAAAIYLVRTALISLSEGMLLSGLMQLAAHLDAIWKFATVTGVGQLTALAAGFKNLVASLMLTYQLAGVGAILTEVSAGLMGLVGPTGIAAALVALGVGLYKVGEGFVNLYETWQKGGSMWEFFTRKEDDNFIRRWLGLSTAMDKVSASMKTMYSTPAGPKLPDEFLAPKFGPAEDSEATEALKRQKLIADEASEAIKKYKEEVQGLAQKLGVGNAVGDIIKLGDAWRILTPAEQQNKDVVKQVLEQYVKLKEQTGITDTALQTLLETTGTLTTKSTNLAYEAMKVPSAFRDMKKSADEMMNSARGLTKEGLIPFNDTTKEMMDQLSLAPPQIATLNQQFSHLKGGLTNADVAAAHASVSFEKLRGTLKEAQSALSDSADDWRHLADVTDGGTAAFARFVAAVTQGAAIVLKDINNILDAFASGNLIQQIAAIGQAAAHAVGALADVFSVSAGEDIVKRVGRNLGVTITEEMGDAIAETAKKLFKGSREAAEIFSLDELIGAAGGLNSGNFDRFLARLRDTFVMVGQGMFSAAQGAEVLDKNFKAFADQATENGKLVSRQFLEIISLTDQYNVDSRQVREYVLSQTSVALTGIHALLEGTKDLASQTAATGIASSLWAGFDELTKRGLSALEVIQQMASDIELLEDKLRKAGFSGGEAFDAIRSMAALATDEIAGPAIEGIHGAAQALTGLHNVGRLNQDMFAGLAEQITTTFNNLVQQGKDGSAALALIAPDLQKLWELETEFGYTVDDATQQLIDQAEAAGLVGEAQKDAQQQAVDAMNKAADAMVRVGDILINVFDDAGAAAENFANTTVNAMNRIPRRIDVTVAGSSEDAIPMAEGGAFTVTRPTNFLVGEAGPEQAIFSGANKGFELDTSGIERRLDNLTEAMMREIPRSMYRYMKDAGVKRR